MNPARTGDPVAQGSPVDPVEVVDPVDLVETDLPGRPVKPQAPRQPRSRPGQRPARLRGAGLPVAVLATAAGVWAALAPLTVSLAVGVLGWFVSDAGIHGAPRSGMRIGALAWLLGHGSTVTVQGTVLTVIPLGVTAICAWVVWRVGYRLGSLVSGHGPDADRIADGERDWTVPAASALFALGYAVVAVVAVSLAGGTDANPRLDRVLVGVVLLSGLIALPAITAGSGRGAVWLGRVPWEVRHALAAALSVLGWLLAVAGVVFAVSLAVHFAAAATMVSQLHTTLGESLIYLLVNAGFLPNAVLASGSWLLGPGFTVGAGTVVSPHLVVLGPLPLLPILAALPGAGAPAAWAQSLLGLPSLAAAVAVFRTQLRLPTLRWDHGALRGCAAGLLAGAGFAGLCLLAGGAAGPGRLRAVGPILPEVGWYAVVSLGLGGLLGGLVATWWLRRTAAPDDIETRDAD